MGHDEYWTLDMFENVKGAVEQGLNVAFLSGNALMWMIDLQHSIDNNAVMIDLPSGLGFKQGERIPARPNLEGHPYRTINRIGRFGGVSEAEKALGIMGPFMKKEWPNENTLIGVRTMYIFNGSADWIMSSPDHWIFEGIGMRKGDKIPGFVGWEHHGDPADIWGLEVIAEGTIINEGGLKSHYTATVYPGPKGNWVFNAATIFWSIGLS